MSADYTIRQGRGRFRRLVEPAAGGYSSAGSGAGDVDFDALDRLGRWLEQWPIEGDAVSVDSATALQCLGRVTLRDREGTDRADGGFMSGAIALDRLNVLACRTEAEVTLVMEESSERYLFWLPLSGHVDVADRRRASASRVERGQLCIMPALANMRATLSPDAGFLGVVVPQSALLSGIETLVGVPVSGHVTFDDRSLSLGSAVGTMILRLLQLLQPVCMEQSLSPSKPAFFQQVESMIVLAIVSALPHNFTLKAVGEEVQSVAPAVVSLAESYMQKNAAESISLEDIAMVTGYGVRTLQLAFRQFRNTTPMSQLRRIRLDLIHRELSHPDEGTTVASAARAWQFPNTGRMSKRFQQIYGETPQQVLRRGRRNAEVRGRAASKTP